jgi:hypothetical protein
MNTIKVSNLELQKLLDSVPAEFPKYTTQIINLANQNAGGTRPKVVGQLSDLIQQFPNESLAEWEKWYLELYPDAIEDATEKIFQMVNNLKEAIHKIDKPMIEKWVRDLVLVKTFIGLRFQLAILKKVAEEKGEPYSFSSVEEEAQGIDGYIGSLPVSIKPDTYKVMNQLPESIAVSFIYYTKMKDGIRLEYDF